RTRGTGCDTGTPIPSRMLEFCYADMAACTVYALLVRLAKRGLVDSQKVPSTQGPPRKLYSVNAAGQAYLEEFWSTWHFLADRLHRLSAERPAGTGSTATSGTADNNADAPTAGG